MPSHQSLLMVDTVYKMLEIQSMWTQLIAYDHFFALNYGENFKS
jgi:hypothetical protein